MRYMGISTPLTSHEEMKGKRQVRETKYYVFDVKFDFRIGLFFVKYHRPNKCVQSNFSTQFHMNSPVN